MTIQQAEDKGKLIGAALVTDISEVDSILSDIGKIVTANKKGIFGLFVHTKDGAYTCVYGFKGNVPYNDKELTKLL